MTIKRTPLHEQCIQNGGRFSPFAGWEMPIQFSGLKEEHKAVRNHAGVFDISHMGIFKLEGTNTKDALQKLVPSDLSRIGPNEACYTLLLNNEGKILDDLIIYDLGVNKKNKEEIIIVINAACTESDICWITKHLADSNIIIKDIKKEGVFLAIQGPNAEKLLQKYFESQLNKLQKFNHKYFSLKFHESDLEKVFIARTGYTGEDGFELLLSAEQGKFLFKSLIDDGIKPCGLGSRDTLRLEAGMHLYGNDMNSENTPFEASLGWTVHLEMQANFIGRQSLEIQAKEGAITRLVGLKIKSLAIARKGYLVFKNETQIGFITSGTWSPSLDYAIAMAYVPIEMSKPGTNLFVDIRGKKHPVEVVKRPFLSRK
tara:strand:- start:1351 stop:2463 length:1113 start_codon:yes stop_codon:yes gene_type:complete